MPREPTDNHGANKVFVVLAKVKGVLWSFLVNKQKLCIFLGALLFFFVGYEHQLLISIIVSALSLPPQYIEYGKLCPPIFVDMSQRSSKI